MVAIIDWFKDLFSPIQTDPKIIQKNLSLMTSEKPCGMQRLLSSESMGGNAGSVRKYPCLGARFFYNPNTGKIKLFENDQNVPKMIKEGYGKAIFRVAFNIKSFREDTEENKYRILTVSYEGKPSALVKKIIEDSITAYNQKYGFEMR